MAALPGSVIPSDSAIEAMVDAVPITMQWPLEREMQSSISHHSASVSRPARNSSQYFQTSVPEPSSSVPYMPRSMGPPVTMMAGTSALAAPISMAGVVLSQPERRTTPSKGSPRMHSSTSIDMRLRKSIVVGFIRGSESEMTGNSRGKPPARHTPRLTCSATVRRCALQLVASLHELAMPMTGRPRKASSGKPSAFR